jgi:hypothetical protein
MLMPTSVARPPCLSCTLPSTRVWPASTTLAAPSPWTLPITVTSRASSVLPALRRMLPSTRVPCSTQVWPAGTSMSSLLTAPRDTLPHEYSVPAVGTRPVGRAGAADSEKGVAGASSPPPPPQAAMTAATSASAAAVLRPRGSGQRADEAIGKSNGADMRNLRS